jgi:hypothetical protein
LNESLKQQLPQNLNPSNIFFIFDSCYISKRSSYKRVGFEPIFSMDGSVLGTGRGYCNIKTFYSFSHDTYFIDPLCATLYHLGMLYELVVEGGMYFVTTATTEEIKPLGRDDIVNFLMENGWYNNKIGDILL